MSSREFDRRLIHQQLAQLGPRQQAAFAALCAERLLPFYRWFSQLERWGSYDRLLQALSAVWAYVEGRPLDPDEFERLISECRLLMPDTEDFNTPLVSGALDATVAIVLALQICLEPSQHMASEVAGVAVDAAFGVAQLEAIENLGEVRIANREQLEQLLDSDRVSREIDVQKAALEVLRRGGSNLDVASLRQLYGQGNLL